MHEIGHDYSYRSLCEHLGVALIATDLELKIELWNAAAARMFGAASDRMFGTSITQILPKESREQAEKMIHEVIATGETVQIEFEHRDDHGARRELAGTIAAVVSESGDRVGASICFRDITRRMSLQDEIHENRKMAALGEMAGALSHHFNNILGGAITSIDYANAADDPELKGRVLEHVGHALQRAITLIDGLLAFSAGDHRAEERATLETLVEQFRKETEQRIEGTTIKMELAIGDVTGLSYPRQPVLTILRNIVRNAVEAMPKGGQLGIRVDRRETDVIISISDTGCGLPQDSKSRIFEPFWTTKEMLTTKSGEAIGLGLAVSHGLVRMLGGKIRVESETGTGSSFHVTLPATKE